MTGRADELGTALDPYLPQIAQEMKNAGLEERKTVVFLPLIKTSQKFCRLLNECGFRAAEVNGQSEDRSQILKDFDAGKYDVLCNSLLLTEGWDCPSVDCIVNLRPTKSRALYAQIVGRGTRLSPDTGKTDLLLLDFLWMTDRLELVRPASLVTSSRDVAQKMTKMVEDAACPVDLEEVEHKASEEVVAEREGSPWRTSSRSSGARRRSWLTAAIRDVYRGGGPERVHPGIPVGDGPRDRQADSHARKVRHRRVCYLECGQGVETA